MIAGGAQAPLEHRRDGRQASSRLSFAKNLAGSQMVELSALILTRVHAVPGSSST